MNIVLTTLNAKYIHSSLALRYLKAYVKEDFPAIEIREYTIKEPVGRIVSDLYTRKPDVIGFSVYIWNVEEILPILSMLKKVLPHIVIVLGGPEVSYDTRAWMERVPEADYIVQGEGEATFHHLLQVLQSGGLVSDVHGIAYREQDQVHVTKSRTKLDLATIPNPYGDEEDVRSLQNRIVYYETSRGCPFSCQFCLSSIETGVRYVPLDRVTSELQRLMDAGIRTIKFVDRTFNLHRRYALDLFRYLIDNRRETVFQFEITGDILHKEIVEFLTAHAPPGLFRFEIGIQSTNDFTNSLVHRRQNFERLTQNILAIQQGGNIVQHLDLIAGLPEEDYESFRKTFNEVFAFEPDELQLGFLKMLRGTGLRLRAAEHEYVYMDHAPYEVFSNRVLPYDDVLRMKQVEDVLEKYWNEGKLRNTVRFLTRHVFESPFDFFQQFGSFWEVEGWDRIGHQLEDLFHRLNRFLTDRCTHEQLDSARSYMMYDFLIQHRIRPHKVWWDKNLHKSERAELVKALAEQAAFVDDSFEALKLTPEDLEKHTMMEWLPRRIHPLNPDKLPEAGPVLLLVYYSPGLKKGAQPQPFVAPMPNWVH